MAQDLAFARRLISRSTASRTNVRASSPSASAARTRSIVPAAKLVRNFSGHSSLRPTRRGISHISFCSKPDIFRISVIDYESTISDIRYRSNRDEAMTYALPITEPRTRKEGLLNFVQMIINAGERGDVQEAILLAVDLKDTLSGNANPFADITDGLTKDAVVKEVAAARESMERVRAQEVAKAFSDGGARARAEMLRRLQEA